MKLKSRPPFEAMTNDHVATANINQHAIIHCKLSPSTSSKQITVKEANADGGKWERIAQIVTDRRGTAIFQISLKDTAQTLLVSLLLDDDDDGDINDGSTLNRMVIVPSVMSRNEPLFLPVEFSVSALHLYHDDHAVDSSFLRPRSIPNHLISLQSTSTILGYRYPKKNLLHRGDVFSDCYNSGFLVLCFALILMVSVTKPLNNHHKQKRRTDLTTAATNGIDDEVITDGYEGGWSKFFQACRGKRSKVLSKACLYFALTNKNRRCSQEETVRTSNDGSMEEESARSASNRGDYAYRDEISQSSSWPVSSLEKDFIRAASSQRPSPASKYSSPLEAEESVINIANECFSDEIGEICIATEVVSVQDIESSSADIKCTENISCETATSAKKSMTIVRDDERPPSSSTSANTDSVHKAALVDMSSSKSSAENTQSQLQFPCHDIYCTLRAANKKRDRDTDEGGDLGETEEPLQHYRRYLTGHSGPTTSKSALLAFPHDEQDNAEYNNGELDLATASETSKAAVVNVSCKNGSVRNGLHDILLEMMNLEEVNRTYVPGSIESDYFNLGTKFAKENSFMMAAVAVKRKSAPNDTNPTSKKLCVEMDSIK